MGKATWGLRGLGGVMNDEATLLTTLGLLTVAAIALVLFDRFAKRITAPDPEHEDWPA